jgi:hypothetical protein
LAEAVRRFGEPKDLTRDLQESVPRLERIALVPLPTWKPLRRRRGESPFRHNLRLNGWVLTVNQLAYLLMFLVTLAISARRPPRADHLSNAQTAIFFGGVAFLQFAVMIGGCWISSWLSHDFDRYAKCAVVGERRRVAARIAGCLMLGSALVGGSSAGLQLLIEYLVPVYLITPSGFWKFTIGAGALGVPFVLLQARDWRSAIRRFDHWESLDLDEPQPE